MGVVEARTMIQSIDLTAPAGSEIRRFGLVQSRAELAWTGGRRSLLVTVDYPRN
jgi:hypothetical protein